VLWELDTAKGGYPFKDPIHGSTEKGWRKHTALSNARSCEKLVRDPLTGESNVRGYEKMIFHRYLALSPK